MNGNKMLDQRATQQPAIDPQFAAQLKALAEADNLAGSLDEGILDELAEQVMSDFETDEASMADWKEKMEQALDLAMLVKGDKNTPWQDASNIRYPLITSAALQYNARAYPAIVPSTDIVRVAVFGEDRDAQKANRAQRVGEFMSWQLKVDSREWERGTDQITLQLPIIGDVFRKLWYDPAKGRIRSQVRLPGKHIVINNNCTTLASAPRVSDQIKLYPHQIDSNMRSGRFVEFEYHVSGSDKQEPQEFIEQLCRFDLDGDDYAEPYVVTVHKDSRTVVRVLTAWNLDTVRIKGNQIVEAEPADYLTHYQFLPSMDGGFFGTGLGILLGDISETVNSTLNMLMDSGHLSSLGGGFIGAQNFRVKGGVTRLRPGEYKQVNFMGDDIRKGIVPMQFPGPSDVLFSVLGMLIDSGREIASVNEILTGDSGQANLPVGTVMALIDQGMQVFTASYKRIYRALLDEFEMICRINARHLSPQRYNAFFDGEEQFDPAQDFNLADMDIQPVADPNSVTSMQKMGRAQFLLEMANMGRIDPMAATMRVLDAAQIDSPEELMPKPDPAMQAMGQFQEEMMVLDLKMKEAEIEKTIAETMAELAKAEKDTAEADLKPLKTQVSILQTQKEVLGTRLKQIEAQNGRVNAGSAGGMAGASRD